MKKSYIQQIGAIFILLSTTSVKAQMITGVWKGRINKQKTEIKIVLSGDSLLGSAYYYESANTYRRYSIKGYFDANTNEAVWWDDQFIEERSGRLSISIPGKVPLLSRADFNCPGGGSKMMLDGKAVQREDDTDTKGDLHLDKTNSHLFSDEWDFVIDNYTAGGNDPELIHNISKIAEHWPPEKEDVVLQVIPESTETNEKKELPVIERKIQTLITKTEIPKESLPAIKIVEPADSSGKIIVQKFVSRKKVLTTEIPLSGDSIELRFYDNAIVDGDSISLFLNNKLLFEHIRLLGKAFIVRLAVNELSENSELTMVAENLGSIPPNTAYMVAIVDDKRYEARLESTEGSSAMIRFVKPKATPPNLP